MSKVLFVTYRMMRGYGVDLVTAQHCRALTAAGDAVAILCVEYDGSYSDIDVIVAAPHYRALRTVISRLNPDVVITCSAPFFDRLPKLKQDIKTAKWIVWEHGDPNPLFFDELGQQARQNEIDRKRSYCYPAADALIVISDFIRRDIGYESSKPPKIVIYNGADHAPALGPKSLVDLSPDGRPLRIGTLARLGAGEARYKGFETFVGLIQTLRGRGVEVQPCFLGRGTAAEAQALISAGFEVELNSSEDRKWSYLRGLDLFVSCSQWEGFNLPLVEAQAVGTLGLALDVGAHPEVASLVFRDTAALCEEIEKLALNRKALTSLSAETYWNTREKFSWTKATGELQGLMRAVGVNASTSATKFEKDWITKILISLGRARHYIRYELALVGR